MPFQRFKYDKDLDVEFAKELRKEVNQYFQDNHLDKTADGKMIFKSFAVVGIYLIPYFLMISGAIENIYLVYACWIAMGVGKAGIGLNIMHDSIHGSYSKSKWVNSALSLSMNLIGGNAYVWYMQHNVLHHTYPNIEDTDDDIDIPFLLRMSPSQPRYWFHKFQQVYIWLLYSFATLFWITTKDFVQLGKYKQRGLIGSNKEFFFKWMNVLLWKVVYYAYALAVPVWLMDIPIGHIIVGFVLMHLIAGIILSLIFQPAHVFLGTEYIDQEEQNIDKSWIGYQLETTTNFKMTGFSGWIAGGLNYQVEHHLFPNICHTHYADISPIVSRVAQKYNLPYYMQDSHYGALNLHYKMVESLGTQ